jgi:HipA-like C-terminal domain
MNDVSLPILIKTLLAQRGLLTSAELQSVTGKSQATLSRALKQLLPQVQALGRGRGTRYGLTRQIMGHAAQQALYFVNADAIINLQWGLLTFLEGERLHVQAPDLSITTLGELPWFLETMKPQGFLGRLRGQAIGFGDTNPDNWSLEQTLFAIWVLEQNTPGAISIGERFYPTLGGQEVDPQINIRATQYDAFATNITNAGRAGSSAGGEQPKFLASFKTDTEKDSNAGFTHVIVKFSPPRGTPFGERWHDLLHTELIALQTLAKHGFSTAKTRIVQSAQRTYLESERFDRIGRFGKRHVVPLTPVHKHFVGGSQQNWAATCDKLADLGHLPHQDAHTVHALLYFGRLIGNTDMHFGNLSLAVNDMSKLVNPKFSLAPCYDMLTMAYKPNAFTDGYAALEVPRQPLGADATWQQALTMAKEFWETLGNSEAVSADLRRVAVNQRKLLQ